LYADSSRLEGMTTKKLLALLSLALPACLSEPADLATTDQALTPAVAPLGTFEMRNDKIVYVGYDGTAYRAYELDGTFTQLRQSAPVTASQAPAVENLTSDGTYVAFGDGARTMRLSLNGAGASSFDAFGVFNKSLRGTGAVTLRDGTLARLINGNGFGLGTASPLEVYSGAQPTGAPLLSEGARAYVSPAGNYLRIVDVDARTTTSTCKSATPYASSKTLATAHDQASGNFRIVAKLTDGRLAECMRTALGTTLKIHDLPFTVGDVSFDGGGGIEVEGGGGINQGLGIWVASATTPELAHILPTGKITIIPAGAKIGITPIPIPFVVRSFTDGSAAVLMSNHQFVRVAP
jgi:hypothetical protein